MAETGGRDVTRTLDMTGYFCPEPVIRAGEEIPSIEVGQVLEVLADDPSSRSDIESWAKRTGHEIVSIDEEGDVLRFLIRRTS
jgi:tRNA 2-thiouridine synthesizing protein A